MSHHPTDTLPKSDPPPKSDFDVGFDRKMGGIAATAAVVGGAYVVGEMVAPGIGGRIASSVASRLASSNDSDASTDDAGSVTAIV